MNGEQLPLLNGFPLRLVVPGWYSTYWVKMLSDVEVLDHVDDQYWMTTAYRIADTPDADVKPGAAGFKTVPINRMNPRSFVTKLKPSQTVAAGAPVAVRGIALGGDTGVARVDVSTDAGRTWLPTKLRPWRARRDPPSHRHRRRDPARGAELEPRGLHAEWHRDDETERVLRSAGPNGSPSTDKSAAATPQSPLPADGNRQSPPSIARRASAARL